MGKHHRRDGYWKSYHLAHTRELDAIAGGIVSLVKESKPPVQCKKTRRGRKPVHSREKLVCICLLMIVMGYTFRDMQNQVPKLSLPWDEPYPDHSTIHRAYQNLPVDYLDALLESVVTAQVNLARAGSEAVIEEAVADKGYHKAEALADCAERSENGAMPPGV